MIKVEVVNDEHQEGVRWLKVSHNGVAWSLIEFRSNEEAMQIIDALKQSVQQTGEQSSPK
jgi:hydrogenase maturation factor